MIISAFYQENQISIESHLKYYLVANTQKKKIIEQIHCKPCS